MRKFFTFMIATAAISLASCGGKSNGSTAELDSLATETVAEEDATPAEQAQAVITLLQEQIKNADPEQIKAIGQQVADKVAEFIAKGDAEAAKTYSETINRFISDNAETLKSIGASTTIAEALSKVEDLPAGILEAATGAATGVQASADAQVDAAKAAIEAAQDAAAAAQKQAEDAAAAAQQKAQDKANQAIDDAAAAAKKKLGL